jgi:hypothetical protein
LLELAGVAEEKAGTTRNAREARRPVVLRTRPKIDRFASRKHGTTAFSASTVRLGVMRNPLREASYPTPETN